MGVEGTYQESLPKLFLNKRIAPSGANTLSLNDSSTQ